MILVVSSPPLSWPCCSRRLPPPRVINKQENPSGVSLSALGPAVTIGIILASVGYGFMNLLMVANPLQLQVCGIEFTTLSYLIQFHVLLMFGSPR